MDISERFWEIVLRTYDKLEAKPRPKPYKIGGTYYGSTQLFSSVGNHLDLIDNEPYAQCSSMWGIRIGGAYELDDYEELRDFLKENRKELLKEGYCIIDDYGTNFSVYGIGIR
jgi:hypothetical protein